MYLGLELFKGLLELCLLPFDLFHFGQGLGQGTYDCLHILLVGGLQLFPVFFGCNCLLS